jgi:hypothetical protein
LNSKIISNYRISVSIPKEVQRVRALQAAAAIVNDRARFQPRWLVQTPSRTSLGNETGQSNIYDSLISAFDPLFLF